MNHRITSLIAFSLVMCLSAICYANEEATAGMEPGQTLADVVAHYASGTINSTEIASQALEDVNRQRGLVEEQFSKDEAICYEKFFVTSCMDAAKDRRRKALKQLRAIEVEANAYNRRANVEERDKALRERQAKQDAEATERKTTSNQATSESAPANPQDIADVENRAAQTTAGPEADPSKHYNTERAAQHAAQQAQEREKERAEEKKREENIKAYERKQQRSLERQREIADRKKEKEQGSAAKNQ